VLQRLGDHIKACIERAAAADQKASQATDPIDRAEHSEMALRWRHLARSYEFVVSLEQFLLDAQRTKDTKRHTTRCPDCGKPMRLAGAEPDERYLNLDQYYFTCECGHGTTSYIARQV